MIDGGFPFEFGHHVMLKLAVGFLHHSSPLHLREWRRHGAGSGQWRCGEQGRKQLPAALDPRSRRPESETGFLACVQGRAGKAAAEPRRPAPSAYGAVPTRDLPGDLQDLRFGLSKRRQSGWTVAPGLSAFIRKGPRGRSGTRRRRESYVAFPIQCARQSP